MYVAGRHTALGGRRVQLGREIAHLNPGIIAGSRYLGCPAPASDPVLSSLRTPAPRPNRASPGAPPIQFLSGAVPGVGHDESSDTTAPPRPPIRLRYAQRRIHLASMQTYP
jgi:hypothetical protein